MVREFGLRQTGQLLLPELLRGSLLKRPGPRWLGATEARFRMRDSTVLWLRPFSMDLGVFHEIWDHQRYTAGKIATIVRDGTVIDIGAHIGLFSIFASKILLANRTVSVEPDPENFRLLSKNIHDNNVKSASLINAAIAGVSGERQMITSQSNTGGHSFFGAGSSRRVKTLSLEDLFRSLRISECSLLKMDCEGAEMEILQSAPDTLLRNVLSISLEYHLAAYSLEDLERFTKKAEGIGFDMERQPTSEVLGLLRGIRRGLDS